VHASIRGAVGGQAVNLQDLSDDDLAKWRDLTRQSELLESAANTAWEHVLATYKEASAVGINDKVEADEAVIAYQTAHSLHVAAERAVAAFADSKARK
jgi:hypothetical protein